MSRQSIQLHCRSVFGAKDDGKRGSAVARNVRFAYCLPCLQSPRARLRQKDGEFNNKNPPTPCLWQRRRQKAYTPHLRKQTRTRSFGLCAMNESDHTGETAGNGFRQVKLLFMCKKDPKASARFRVWPVIETNTHMRVRPNQGGGFPPSRGVCSCPAGGGVPAQPGGCVPAQPEEGGVPAPAGWCVPAPAGWCVPARLA